MLYPLGWSDLYPNLSTVLVVFLILSSLISSFIGLIFHKRDVFSYTCITFSPFLLWFFSFLIFASYFLEFAYHGLIPLLTILKGSDYQYTSFGIPTFHVIVVVFNSFWAVFVFHNILSQKKKSLYIPYLMCLIPPILIFNRGMFMMILVSSIFVLFMQTSNLKKLLLRVIIFMVAVLFLFGIAGNLRIRGGDVSANDLILKAGRASANFKNSFVPDQFFWSYLYITTPLANTQETLNVHYSKPTTLTRIAVFINSELIPDFISKRNIYLFDQAENMDQISINFTVGSVFAKSCAYFGAWGLVVMFMFISFFNLLIILLINKDSIFFVSSIAILNSIMLFNFFDNMFHFSGLVLQLAFPIIFGGLLSVKNRIAKISL